MNLILSLGVHAQSLDKSPTNILQDILVWPFLRRMYMFCVQNGSDLYKFRLNITLKYAFSFDFYACI